MADAAVERVRAKIIRALKSLEPLFLPGAKLSFIMRRPGDADCYVVITNDELPELEAVVRRHREQTEADRG